MNIGFNGTNAEPGVQYLVGGWKTPLSEAWVRPDLFSARVAARELAEKTNPEMQYPVLIIRAEVLSKWYREPSKIVEHEPRR